MSLRGLPLGTASLTRTSWEEKRRLQLRTRPRDHGTTKGDVALRGQGCADVCGACRRMWPRDGRGDHLLQGQVCADGRGRCRHRRGAARESLARPREGCGDHRLCGQVRAECRRELLPRTGLPGGRGSGGAPRQTRFPVRLRGDVSSVDEASQATVWRTVTDEATAKKGSVGRHFRSNRRTALVVIASIEKSVRTAVGDVVADEAAGRRGSGTGDRLRKQGHRTAAGSVASVDKASSAEGRAAETCRRDSQGRCGRVAADEVAGGREG